MGEGPAKPVLGNREVSQMGSGFQVRRGRLELPCPCGRYHLKVVRLPISPPAQRVYVTPLFLLFQRLLALPECFLPLCRKPLLRELRRPSCACCAVDDALRALPYRGCNTVSLCERGCAL